MTMKLRVFQLRIPGEWNDGWLYKQHLILWSRDGHMFVARLEELLDKLRVRLTPALSAVADYAIFRNDWKSSEQFHRLMDVADVRMGLFKDFQDSDDPFAVEIESLEMRRSQSDPVPGFILDVSLYADHIFAGSSEGFFESRFDAQEPQARRPVVQWLDKEIGAVNAKNSVVNSSAGEEGLLFSQVNFQDDKWWSERPIFKRTADISTHNSFAKYHVLNYADAAFPTFLRAETEPRPNRADGSGYQESRVIAYQSQADISLIAGAAIKGSRRVKLSESHSLQAPGESEPTGRVLGNSVNRLLVHWGDSLKVIDISAPIGKDITARPDPKYDGSSEADVRPSSVLRTYAIESGFLVELFDEIRLITPAGSYLMAAEQAARIRTFVYSRRYQDMALVVGEESVTLVGFIESSE